MKAKAPQLWLLDDAPPDAKRLRAWWELNLKIEQKYRELINTRKDTEK